MRAMEIRVRQTCATCDGSGKAPPPPEYIPGASRIRVSEAKCADCHGTGKREQWLPLEELKSALG
jgi:DnaJ-class molecular chaperone